METKKRQRVDSIVQGLMNDQTDYKRMKTGTD